MAWLLQSPFGFFSSTWEACPGTKCLRVYECVWEPEVDGFKGSLGLVLTWKQGSACKLPGPHRPRSWAPSLPSILLGGALCYAECIFQRPGDWVLAEDLAPWSSLLPVSSHFVPSAWWTLSLFLMIMNRESEWWRNVPTIVQLGSGRRTVVTRSPSTRSHCILLGNEQVFSPPPWPTASDSMCSGLVEFLQNSFSLACSLSENPDWHLPTNSLRSLYEVPTAVSGSQLTHHKIHLLPQCPGFIAGTSTVSLAISD